MQTNATKETARKWMQQRQAGHRPLPTMQEIRRALGWEMIDAMRETGTPVGDELPLMLKNQVFI